MSVATRAEIERVQAELRRHAFSGIVHPLPRREVTAAHAGAGGTHAIERYHAAHFRVAFMPLGDRPIEVRRAGILQTPVHLEWSGRDLYLNEPLETGVDGAEEALDVTYWHDQGAPPTEDWQVRLMLAEKRRRPPEERQRVVRKKPATLPWLGM